MLFLGSTAALDARYGRLWTLSRWKNSPKIIIHFDARVQLNSHEAGQERIFIETVFIFG